ncbi:MAG TPA: hypothetical protein VL171_07345 [Verrucomicrobiae bacterium]|nr:hypothetical protein [Verrucomicrobiae bacterium]
MVVALVLGLMAKPMLITLPFVLILLDYWPLRRLAGGPFNRGNLRFLVEKTPLIFLCSVSTVLTYIGQRRVGGLAPVTELPMHIRLANALVAYVGYLAKTVWPARLAVFYPYPSVFPASQVIFCAAIVLGITVMAIQLARGHPPDFALYSSNGCGSRRPRLEHRRSSRIAQLIRSDRLLRKRIFCARFIHEPPDAVGHGHAVCY